MQKLACDACGKFENLKDTKHKIKHVKLIIIEDPRPQMTNPVLEADTCDECLPALIGKYFRQIVPGELPGFLSEPTERERALRVAT